LKYIKKRSNLSDEETKKANKLFYKVIVIDNRPITFGNSEEMENFINFLNPNYKIPSYTKIMTDLGKINQEVFMKLTEILKGIEYGALTSDGWESLSKDHFLTNHFKFYNTKTGKIEIRNLGSIILDEIHITGGIGNFI